MEVDFRKHSSSSRPNSRSQDSVSALPTYVIQEDNKAAHPLTVLSSDESYSTRRTQNKSSDNIQEYTRSPTHRRSRWIQEKVQRASVAHPRLSRIVLWLRGPRPTVELPGACHIILWVPHCQISLWAQHRDLYSTSISAVGDTSCRCPSRGPWSRQPIGLHPHSYSSFWPLDTSSASLSSLVLNPSWFQRNPSSAAPRPSCEQTTSAVWTDKTVYQPTGRKRSTSGVRHNVQVSSCRTHGRLGTRRLRLSHSLLAVAMRKARIEQIASSALQRNKRRLLPSLPV